MNYLAHIYLSGESEQIQVGNFIGDYVKGNQYNNFAENIKKGILLHRKIDYFTDNHPIVAECKKQLRPGFGKHAGIVTDIFFDHFLASNWFDYADMQLAQFAKRFNITLMLNFAILPLRVKLFFPFFVQHKRLQSYADLWGIERTLQIMGQRTSLPENSVYAMDLLKTEYLFFDNAFAEFFPELIEYVENEGDFKILRPKIGG